MADDFLQLGARWVPVGRVEVVELLPDYADPTRPARARLTFASGGVLTLADQADVQQLAAWLRQHRGE